MIVALEVAITDEIAELNAEIREHDLHTAALRARIASLGTTFLQFSELRKERRD